MSKRLKKNCQDLEKESYIGSSSIESCKVVFVLLSSLQVVSSSVELAPKPSIESSKGVWMSEGLSL